MPTTIDADFTIERGRLTTRRDVQYVAQRAAQHLRFLNGESFLYPSQGIEYYQTLFGGPLSGDAAAQVLATSLQNAIPEITRVDVLTVELPQETRRLRLRFGVATIYGDFEMPFEAP